jgi:hypothetical protein
MPYAPSGSNRNKPTTNYISIFVLPIFLTAVINDG